MNHHAAKLTTHARAAVMVAASQDLDVRQYPIPDPAPGGALVRVRCCTICRSDLHTWSGKRPGPTPCILGHEIVGEIVAVGEGLSRDLANQRLGIGDRITWTLHSSCGRCFYCLDKRLSMKCLHLRKYGHDACDQPPHLQGGFAEFCLIDAGTSVIKLPDCIPDAVAAPLNCAAATVVAGWEAAELVPCDNVLIQGAGGLGCYAAAFASMSGANRVIVSDVDPRRLEFVKKFGATDCVLVAGQSDQYLAEQVRALTGGFGADCALEVAGVPTIVPAGLAALRKGGRYVELGCSFPGAVTPIDLSVVLWNWLTIRGVHNYDASHLHRAVNFVAQTINRFPYDELISARYPLAEINAALRAAEHASHGRVAIEFL